MYESVFESLGLSPSEAKIYYALIMYGGSGVSTISIRSNVHRRNAYDAIHRLIEKGLVYEVFGGKETIYESVEPTKLSEFVHEKEQLLEQALPELMRMFETHKTPQSAYIYKGIEGVKNYLREALQIGEDLYSFAAKGAWLDPRLKTYIGWFLKEATKRKMKFRFIFDPDAQEKIPEVFSTLEVQYKLLPKGYGSATTTDVFGDHVVTFTGVDYAKIEDNTTIFVMKSSRLAEGYRIWWQYMWDSLPNPPKMNQLSVAKTGKSKKPRKKNAKK